jgi:hypothetical protein
VHNTKTFILVVLLHAVAWMALLRCGHEFFVRPVQLIADFPCFT